MPEYVHLRWTTLETTRDSVEENMRKSIYRLGTALAVALLVMSGCSVKPMVATETETEVRTEESSRSEGKEDVYKEDIYKEDIYKDTIKTYYDYVLNKMSKGDFTAGFYGVYEALHNYSGSEALSKIGYIYRNLDGDNIPELLFVLIDESDDKGSEVVAVYTVVDGTVKMVCEGATRNSYKIVQNSRLLHQMYGGYLNSTVELVKIEKGNVVAMTSYICEPSDSNSNEPKYIRKTNLGKETSETIIDKNTYESGVKELLDEVRRKEIFPLKEYMID